MLLPQLILEHPESIETMLARTPNWVWVLLAALIWLGLKGTRERFVSLSVLWIRPLCMTLFSLWGVVSAFGGHAAYALPLWLACYGLVLLATYPLPPHKNATYDAAQRLFHLPGSWVPMVLILAMFAVKWSIGVQLAMEPQLVGNHWFVYSVVAIYGVLSGLFSARTLRLFKLMRRNTEWMAQTH